MAMDNKRYWNDRFTRLIEEVLDDAGTNIDNINEALDFAYRSIEKEITAYYAKYAKDNKLTLIEAQQYLQNNERREFLADIKRYTRMAQNNADGRFNQVLDALAARVHISRLEALKIRSAMFIREAYAAQADELTSTCKNALEHSYLCTAYEIQTGIGKYEPVQQIDGKSVKKALAMPWTSDGQTFSDRIWKNQNQLVHTLSQEFTRGFIAGVDPAQMTNNIQHMFSVAKYAAARLVNTEAAYFASEGTRYSYQEFGLDQYQILATLDDKTCDICADLDGQIFDMKEYEVGVTAPPFHPNCRTTTIPVIKDDVVAAGEARSAKDADGNYYTVDGSLTYREWENDFVTE